MFQQFLLVLVFQCFIVASVSRSTFLNHQATGYFVPKIGSTLLRLKNAIGWICVGQEQQMLHCDHVENEFFVVPAKLDGLLDLIIANSSFAERKMFFIQENDSIDIVFPLNVIRPSFGEISPRKLDIAIDIDRNIFESWKYEIIDVVNHTFNSHVITLGSGEIEPASWFGQYTPMKMVADGHVMNGIPEDAYIEFVLTDDDIQLNRRFVNHSINENIVHGGIDNLVITGAATNDEDLREPIHVCLWSANRMDGQKTIWLSQVQNMSRREFRFSWWVSLPDGGKLDGNDSTLWTEQSLFKHLSGLANVQAMDSPFNDFTVNETELETEPDGGGAPAAATWNGDIDQLFRYPHERFQAAGGDINAMSPAWTRRLYLALQHHLQKQQCDMVVYGNSRNFNSDVVITDVARVLGVPSVCELLNLYIDKEILPDVMVAPSIYAVEHGSIATHYNSSSSRGDKVRPLAVVIPPSVDTDRFDPDRISRAIYHPHCDACRRRSPAECPCINVGFMARLSSGNGLNVKADLRCTEKNPGLLIQAAKLIHDRYPTARFTMVGDGMLRDALVKLTKRLSIERLFYFAGWNAGDSLPRLLKGMDIVVNPSLRAWSETFCIANIEAMSMRLPVITFAIGGIGEYVREAPRNAAGNFSVGSNAVIVHTATPDALAQAVEKLILEPELRKSIGEVSRESIKEYFSVERQMKQYRNLYRFVKDNYK